MKYNYKYGDGSVVDKSSEDFKRNSDDRRPKKKESVGELVFSYYILSP